MRTGHLILCLALAVMLFISYKVSKNKKWGFSILCWGISLAFLAFIVAFLDYPDKVAAMYEQGVRLSTSWFEALSASILMMEDAPGSGGRLGIGFMWGTISAVCTFLLGFLPIVKRTRRHAA